MNKSKLRLFWLILILGWGVSCEKGDNFQLPGVNIDFTLSIYGDVEFYSLQVAGNSMVITADMLGLTSLGYDNNGIIVYNSGSGFFAFDRTCPNCYPSSYAIESDGGSYGECPNCGSGFLYTTGGTPTTGSESKYALQDYYAVYYSNSGTVRVYN